MSHPATGGSKNEGQGPLSSDWRSCYSIEATTISPFTDQSWTLVLHPTLPPAFDELSPPHASHRPVLTSHELSIVLFSGFPKNVTSNFTSFIVVLMHNWATCVVTFACSVLVHNLVMTDESSYETSGIEQGVHERTMH